MSHLNDPKSSASYLKLGSGIKVGVQEVNKKEGYGNATPALSVYQQKSSDNKEGGSLNVPLGFSSKTKSAVLMQKVSQQDFDNDKYQAVQKSNINATQEPSMKFFGVHKSTIYAKQEPSPKYAHKSSLQNAVQAADSKDKVYAVYKQQALEGKLTSKVKEEVNPKPVSTVQAQMMFKKERQFASKIQQQEQILLDKQHLHVKGPSKAYPTSNAQPVNMKFQMCCIMKANNDVFHLVFNRSRISALEAVADRIKQIYEARLSSYQDIEFRTVRTKVDEQYKSWANIEYQFGERITNIDQWLQDQKDSLAYVGVVIKDSKFAYRHVNQLFKSPEKPQQKLIGIESNDRDGIILKYDAIRPYPVKYILDILDYKKSQGRCLKMHERFYLKDQFLPFDLQRASVNHLTAKVIGEQYEFEKIMRQTVQLREEELNGLVNNPKKVKITPLTVYTGNFTCRQNSKESELTFESLINRYLKNYFRNAGKSEEDWKNRLVKSMMRDMERLPEYQGWTYWICPIDFSSYEADRDKRSITFPEFLRTTMEEPPAETLKKGSTLFKIESKTGKKINLLQLSKFQNTERVIFRPFTNFRIVKSTPSLFELQQTLIEQQTIQVNFLLWVDGNSKESEQTFKRLDCPISTYKYYFDSTQSLQKWLSKQAQEIVRPHIRIIIVTNMRRVQNKVEVKDAGVKTVQMVRKKIPMAPIIVYVQNREVSQNWLRSAKIDLATIELIDSADQFLDTLTNYCCRIPNVKKKKPSPPTVPAAKLPEKLKKQNWRALFDFTLPQ